MICLFTNSSQEFLLEIPLWQHLEGRTMRGEEGLRRGQVQILS